MIPFRLSAVRTCVLACAAIAVASCSSPPVPTDTFYNLSLGSAGAPSVGESIAGVVEVPPFWAEGVINERPIVFRESATQRKQYTYHYWSEPPSVMLQRGLIDSLRASGLFDQVTSPEVRANRDYEIVDTLRRLDHVVAGGPAKVAVEFELSLRRIRGNEALFANTYSAEISAGRSVESAVDAMSDAVNDLFAQAVRDMATLGD